MAASAEAAGWQMEGDPVKTLPLSRQVRLAAVALVAAALLGVAPGLLLAQIAELAPPPAAPAFYTQGPSRVRDIAGDSFTFACDGGREVRVRLFDADCAALGDAARAQAKVVAARLLEESPFWVFPVGQTKAGTTDEVWADVWTSKGWLSQILVRAGYAQRQAGPAGQTLSPIDASGMSNTGPQPVAPAFFAPAKPIGGDALEVQQAGKAIPVHLFDATSEGTDASKGNEASATASKLLGSDGAWVFPCGPQPSDGKSVWPVRIWTREGWLSEVLIKAGQVIRASVAAPLTPAAVAAKPPPRAATPKPAAEKPAAAPRPEKPKPEKAVAEWQAIPVTLVQKTGESAGLKYARAMTGGMAGGTGVGASTALESEIFKVSSNVLRISWEAKPLDKNSRIAVQINRCQDQDTPSKKAGMQAASFAGPTGAQGLNLAPGSYWMKATSASEVTVKLEELVRKAAPAAAP